MNYILPTYLCLSCGIKWQMKDDKGLKEDLDALVDMDGTTEEFDNATQLIYDAHLKSAVFCPRCGEKQAMLEEDFITNCAHDWEFDGADGLIGGHVTYTRCVTCGKGQEEFTEAY